MNRYRYLDIARGIGLMLVIISHSCGLSYMLINYYIPLFFIISGYIYRPGRSYGENIARKAKRLLIPYFGYNIFLLLFYVVMGRTLDETKKSALGILYSRCCLYDTTQFQENIFWLDIANGAMWYLTAFFAACVVYYLVIDRCLSSRKFFIGCCVVFVAVTMALAELPVLLPWSIDVACVAALFMIFGTLLGRAEFFEKNWNILWVLGVFVVYVFLSLINPGINMSLREYGIYGEFSVPFFIAIGVSGSILCVWIAKLVENIFVGRFLEYVGQNTIVLLAFHILGLEIFEILAGKVLDVTALSGAAYVLYHVVRITVAVCGSIVVGIVIDKGKKLFRK